MHKFNSKIQNTLIDINKWPRPLCVDNVIDAIDDVINREENLGKKLIFAQRKLEFLEEFCIVSFVTHNYFNISLSNSGIIWAYELRTDGIFSKFEVRQWPDRFFNRFLVDYFSTLSVINKCSLINYNRLKAFICQRAVQSLRSGENRERACWMKRGMSLILLTCRIDIYSPFCPLSLS